MKHTFKEGDEVEILDTDNIKAFSNGYKKIAGNIVILSKEDVKRINLGLNFYPHNNQYMTNFQITDIKLVKPKEPIYEIY